MWVEMAFVPFMRQAETCIVQPVRERPLLPLRARYGLKLKPGTSRTTAAGIAPRSVACCFTATQWGSLG
jgi:hypothetical protein